jgi:bacterioferritin
MNELSPQVQAVIEVLNKARSMELYSILQYMNQHYVVDDLDYGCFADTIKSIAIDEMRHAEQFAERIRDLKGDPTQTISDEVIKNQELRQIFPFNTKVEQNVLETYNQFALICLENDDAISAHLFRTILMEEQIHHDWFDDQHNHISELGDIYLARHAAVSGHLKESTLGFTQSAGND